MAITDAAFQREIVSHLKSRSAEQRWINNRMGDYLDSVRWKIVNYDEYRDVDTGEEFNRRTFGLSGASEDGRQSGKVIVTTNAADTEFHRIEPVKPKGKLTAAQHDFVALARGEALWITDVVPEPSYADFGSW